LIVKVIAKPAAPMNPQLNLNLNPNRPDEILTRNADEFQTVCDCADRLRLCDGVWTVVRRGDYAIEMISVVPQHNAWYKVKVRWHSNQTSP
jgi:hypothetical protein